MWRYFIRKLNLLVITIMLLSMLSFWLLHLVPGGPMAALNPHASLSLSEQQKLIEQFALDKGLLLQYWNYLGNIVQGHWGVSQVDQVPISQHMISTFLATLQLAISALIIAIVVGVPLGVISALRQGTWLDKTIVSMNMIGQSVPVFWWALMLILVFALGFQWFPISGRLSLLYDIPERSYVLWLDILLADNIQQDAALLSMFRHMALPTMAIAVMPTTILAQTTRASLLEIYEQNYIEAARAKGLSRWHVLIRHALPNYFSGFVRQLGALANPLLTGTMIVEVIFSWPGTGRWLVSSLLTQDVAAIQACMLTISIFVISLSIITDLWAAASSPKERNQPHG